MNLCHRAQMGIINNSVTILWAVPVIGRNCRPAKKSAPGVVSSAHNFDPCRDPIISIMTVVEITNESVTFATLASRVEKDDDIEVFRLKDVKIGGGESEMIRFAKSFRGHPSLEEFSLANVTVTDAAVDLEQIISIVLVTVPNLEKVRIEETKVPNSALATIGFSVTIKELLMPNCNLSDDDITEISSAIAQNKSLETVDFSGNDLSDAGSLTMSTALAKCTSLHVLRLDGNGKISGESRKKIELQLRERSGGIPMAA